MWNEIHDQKDLICFMKNMGYFHDSCIKELKYVSGAYVEDDLSMYPLNDKRILKVIIQRQFKDSSMIEMEFVGLKQLKLFPLDEHYTCEIFESTMILRDNIFYWCDCDGLDENDLENYEGTLICSSKFRWRVIDNCMGDQEFYVSIK